jgi:hypothetical protein
MADSGIKIVRHIISSAEFDLVQRTLQSLEAAGHPDYVCAEKALASVGIVARPGTEIVLEVSTAPEF